MWLELHHVAGEIWRFRRWGRRLQARLSTPDSEMLPDTQPHAPPSQDAHDTATSLAGSNSVHRPRYFSTGSLAPPAPSQLRYTRAASVAAAGAGATATSSGATTATATGLTAATAGGAMMPRMPSVSSLASLSSLRGTDQRLSSRPVVYGSSASLRAMADTRTATVAASVGRTMTPPTGLLVPSLYSDTRTSAPAAPSATASVNQRSSPLVATRAGR